MLCERCHEHEARVFIKIEMQGNTANLSLCGDCARKSQEELIQVLKQQGFVFTSAENQDEKDNNNVEPSPQPAQSVASDFFSGFLEANGNSIEEVFSRLNDLLRKRVIETSKEADKLFAKESEPKPLQQESLYQADLENKELTPETTDKTAESNEFELRALRIQMVKALQNEDYELAMKINHQLHSEKKPN